MVSARRTVWSWRSQLARAPPAIQGKCWSFAGDRATRPQSFSSGPQLSILTFRQESPLRFAQQRNKGVSTVSPQPTSPDYFNGTRQFLSGIEIYPFAGLVQVSQAPVFLALNPDQILVIWIQPADWAVFCE
jgi:hypothetical protein